MSILRVEMKDNKVVHGSLGWVVMNHGIGVFCRTRKHARIVDKALALLAEQKQEQIQDEMMASLG